MRRTILIVAMILAASAFQIDTYFDADPQQCIEEKCPTQWAACQKDPKCIPALQDCEKKCGTKTSCWTLCLPGKGSQAAIDTAKCAQANGCVGMIPSTAVAIVHSQECLEQHCLNQITNCQKDAKCFPALQDCSNECGENVACYSPCLAKKNNLNAISLWSCILEFDCINNFESTAVAIADPQQCIEEKCPTQWAACQKDPKCIPALQDCEKKCGTKTSCWTLCLPGKGSQAAIDTAKCAQANGCVGMVPTIEQTRVVLASPQQCVEQHCRDQLLACQKDPKCFTALQDCEKECGNTTSCYSNCLAKKGNNNASNFWKCILDNDCLNAVESTAVAKLGDIQQCVEEKCPNEWAACQKDSKCVPTLQDCEKKCGTKASCWSLCLTGKGDSAAINVAKCAQSKGCLGVVPSILSMSHDQAVSIFTGPEECVMQYCKKEEQACVNDRRCIAVLDECDTQCNTNFTCWNSCLARRGNKNASDYFKCIIDHECYKSMRQSTAIAIADPQQCIEEKCPNQWAACQKDSKCVPALEDCEKKCGTKTSCWTLCLPGKGSQAAIDVAKCAQANGCVGSAPSTAVALVEIADPQQCIEEKCPNQWAACQKDPKCIPALEDCEKKCGTKTSCWTLCLPGKGSQAAIDTAKCAQANGCVGMVPL